MTKEEIFQHIISDKPITVYNSESLITEGLVNFKQSARLSRSEYGYTLFFVILNINYDKIFIINALVTPEYHKSYMPGAGSRSIKSGDLIFFNNEWLLKNSPEWLDKPIGYDE